MREREGGMEGRKEEEGKSWRIEPIVTAITVVCSQPTDTIPTVWYAVLATWALEREELKQGVPHLSSLPTCSAM